MYQSLSKVQSFFLSVSSSFILFPLPQANASVCQSQTPNSTGDLSRSQKPMACFSKERPVSLDPEVTTSLLLLSLSLQSYAPFQHRHNAPGERGETRVSMADDCLNCPS
ncbi:hypothetical protein TGDOM2_363960 [Toxoplasma gondii GAB2-2007-GAL-DOM2]|uniref:Transmembrane protein n=2 Tax=Toxoplasma gondii TaxID=5811 RepID=A0A2T6IKR0_TOXGO|nr:hypothetical protein TGDOM2_363960 [Toxoplasma gondii GAB2-2007-GAL-DOM2]PUA85922.1 hypothetical protein TGBR9_363960 [Toxoplasma gondii TgCATBr9]